MGRVFLCLMILMFSVGLVGDAMSDQKIKADDLIRGALARDCKERYHTVVSFIKEADSPSLLSLEKELKQKSPQAAVYLKDAIEFVRLADVAGAKTETLIKSRVRTATQKTKLDNKKQSTEAEQAKVAEYLVSSLLTDIDSEKRSLNQAFIMGYLAQQAVHYYPGKEAKPFLEALDRLISNPMLRLRVLAASALASVEPRLKSDKILIPILIEGLKSKEFLVRYYSQDSLQLLTKQEICFNPLDPSGERLQAAAAWQKWWQKESHAQR